MGRWKDIRAGFGAMMPLWLGAAPFGAIYAVSALAAGLTPAQTLGMSLLVFAGSAQFTSVGLFASHASPFTLILTTLIVNARHLLLGASIAPFLRSQPVWRKAALATQLTDESYAIGIRAFIERRGSAAYQFGANISMYLIWQVSTATGLLLGTLIPDPAAYGLDLVFPLTFIGILAPILRNAAEHGHWRTLIVAALAAILSAGTALLLQGHWYILIAGIGASAIGAAYLGRGSPAKKGGQGELPQK